MVLLCTSSDEPSQPWIMLFMEVNSLDVVFMHGSNNITEVKPWLYVIKPRILESSRVTLRETLITEQQAADISCFNSVI